jgi:hypothetical protein
VAWWGTVAGLAALVIGLAVFFLYALSEVIAHPGLSLADGYRIGRLPWTGIGEGFTVMGATAAVVLGSVAILLGGSRWRSIPVPVLLAAAAFFWFLAVLGTPNRGPCTDCTIRVDVFAYAYSVPETTLILLLIPSVLTAALALAVRRGSVSKGSG